VATVETGGTAEGVVDHGWAFIFLGFLFILGVFLSGFWCF